VSLGPLLLAGVLLAVERACYVWIARAPQSFRAWIARPSIAWLGEPVAVVEKLFYAFKVLQLSVFIGWCYVHGGSLTPTAPPPVIAVAVVVLVAGQALIMSAFYQLGRVATFFGDRLGHEVPWCRDFPFSVVPHPQYLGAVLSIWSFFAAMRFPHPDWYLVPALETAYYVAGAVLEERAGSRVHSQLRD
jgi:methylene-fatty-acyl-phospholipid synthase